MAAIHPKPNDEVQVDIIEEQKKEKSESTSKSSTSKSKSIETTNQSLCKKLLKTVIYLTCFFIFECEIILFSGKTIATLPTDVILYRYQILGCCLLFACAFIVFAYTAYLFIEQVVMMSQKGVFYQFVYYCIQNETDSMRWYERNQFVRIILVIGLVFSWLVMFEVGHLLYVIDASIEKPQSAADWNRPLIYSTASLILFVFGVAFVVFLTLGIVIDCFVEPPMNDSTRSCSNKHKK